MKKFFVLLSKELKELLTPQMILPLVISILIFAFIGQIVGTESKKISREKTFIGVVDQSKSPITKTVFKMLEEQDFKLRYYDSAPEIALKQEKEKGGAYLIVIPADFEEKLFEGKQATVRIYSSLSSFSFMSIEKIQKIRAVLTSLNEIVSTSLMEEIVKTAGSNHKIEFLKNPVKLEEFVEIGRIKTKGNPETVIAFVSAQGTFIPIIMTVVIVISSQAVATAIAAEKENKTLETLLTTPVSRKAIALSKMMASGLIALFAAVLYLFGFRYYMNSLNMAPANTQMQIKISELPLQSFLKLSVFDYFLLGLLIFMSILVALAIAIILGAFTDSVKSVQAVITPLMVMVLIPYMLVLFVDINNISSPLKAIVYAIPFSHTFLAMQNLFFSKYQIIMFGILYQFMLFLILFTFVNRIFNSDRILTMKLKLKKA